MSLRVKVEGDSTGFQQTLNNVRQQVKHFGDEVSRSWASGPISGIIGGFAGAFSFEGIKASFEGFLSRAAGLRELSEQLDMSAEATQKWEKAADRLGISFGVIQTVLNSIRDKRFEALTDPKAASLFERLGIKRGDVLNENIGASDFAAMVMRSGMGSEQGRNIITDLIGKRGLRALPAANLYSEVTPDLDEQALDTAHNAELAKKGFGRWIDRQWASILADQGAFWGGLFGGDRHKFFGPLVNNPLDALSGARMGPFAAAGQVPPVGPEPAKKETKPAGEPHDPLKSVLQAMDDERSDRRAKSEEAVRNAQRGLMTIEERKGSIQEELSRLTAREEEIRNRKAPENLKTAQEGLDWEEKRLEQLDEIKAKRAGYEGQLRIAPGHVTADHMARAGLFSAATVNINPAIGIAQQQLRALNSIDRKMGPKTDPHQK